MIHQPHTLPGVVSRRTPFAAPDRPAALVREAAALDLSHLEHKRLPHVRPKEAPNEDP